MKLTAQEEYGLRCLLQLARAPEGFLTIKEIGEAESLTPAYVAKLLRILRKAGLVTSVRGKNGGYELSVPADKLDVGAVVSALGGGFSPPAFCYKYKGNKRTCVHDPDCSLRPVWTAMSRAVHQALSNMRLSDLIRAEPAMHGWLTERASRAGRLA